MWARIRHAKEGCGLFIVVVLAAIITDGLFLQPGNLTDMLRAIAPVGIMAMAMTLVILTAGIDLSIGSVLAFASVATATLLVGPVADLPGVFAILGVFLLVVLSGGIVGALQGALISRLQIQPFIITLAGMIGIRGVAKLWSQNTRIGLGVDRETVAYQFAELISSKFVMIGLLVSAAVVFHVVLKYTVFGRYVRAIGDNEKAAVYAGLPVVRVKVAVYALSGMMASIAGILLCARTRNGDANLGMAYELDAIAMAVIGGTSLAGGRGSVGGTVIGLLIMGTLINVLGLKNVDANVQFILKAVIIVIAVAWQQTRRKF